MQTDFNTDFKDFLVTSKVYQLILNDLEVNDFYKQATGPELKKYQLILQASFEAQVIFHDLVPNQRRLIMRGNLKELTHEFNSKQVKNFIKQSKDTLEQESAYLLSITNLIISRPGVKNMLDSEIQSWKNYIKIQKFKDHLEGKILASSYENFNKTKI